MLDLSKEPFMVIASDGVWYRFDVQIRYHTGAALCALFQIDFLSAASYDVIHEVLVAVKEICCQCCLVQRHQPTQDPSR